MTYTRRYLAPIAGGATERVRFTLEARDPGWLNQDGERLVSAGAYRIHVGGGQPEAGQPGLEAGLRIDGEHKLPG